MITAIIMMFVVGAVLGLILGIASNVFKVEVDERVEKVTAMLPGYNCGSCGFAGCSGMAEAMVAGEVATASACKPTRLTLKPNKTAVCSFLLWNDGQLFFISIRKADCEGMNRVIRLMIFHSPSLVSCQVFWSE